MNRIHAFPVSIVLCVGAMTVGCGGDGILSDAEFRPRLQDAVNEASISLPQAIDIAQAAAPGVPIDAELELNVIGEEQYQVELVDPDEGDKHTIEIDVDSGEVDETDRDDANDGEINEANAVVDAALSLREAVVVAEDEVNGQAYHAEYEDGVYQVDLLSDDDLVDVEISPSDGAVLVVDGN